MVNINYNNFSCVDWIDGGWWLPVGCRYKIRGDEERGFRNLCPQTALFYSGLGSQDMNYGN